MRERELHISSKGFAVVTFNITGVGEDVPLDTVVLVVDDVEYRIAELPISFTWSIGSWHGFQWVEFIPSTNTGKRYAWRATGGITSLMGGILVVPEEGGDVVAYYKAQYSWIINVEGVGPDHRGLYVSVDEFYIPMDLLPFPLWWDEGSHTPTALRSTYSLDTRSMLITNPSVPRYW